MVLTDANYYSVEANKEYMSVSQFKSFRKCEYAALQEINGEYSRAESTALLVGSYVDAYYEGTLDHFRDTHPDIFKRDGSLKADYAQAELIIRRLRIDPFFSKYMSGDKQLILTGQIEGIPFKCKIDSFHPGKAIVDLKVMRNFEPVYVPGAGKLNFIEAWGYDIQGAVYQEIVRQNTGERLPFYIAAATKEATTDLAVFEVPQEILDVQLDLVKSEVERYQTVKLGLDEPIRCGHCECCKYNKVLDRVTTWEELNNEY